VLPKDVCPVSAECNNCDGEEFLMTHSSLAPPPLPTRRPALRTLVALMLSVMLWASAFAGIRVALHGYTPGHLALLRLLIASAALLLNAAVTRMRLPALRDLPAFLAMGFCGVAAYQVLTLTRFCGGSERGNSVRLLLIGDGTDIT
jgi:hypothetical protein